MKRFTDTEKWRDPWFRRLSSPAKQLWGYLLDQCDKIGLIEIDLTLAALDCGQKITQDNLGELTSRLEDCGNGKHFIPKFIHFQYGVLTESCHPHRPIIELVNRHGLILDGLLYHYPNSKSSRVSGTLTVRVQDKDKEKDKEEEGGVGEEVKPLQNGQVTSVFGQPTWEMVLSWLGTVNKDGLKYTENETRMAFNGLQQTGWRIGKTPIVDYRAAMERQIGWDRQHAPHKNSKNKRRAQLI